MIRRYMELYCHRGRCAVLLPLSVRMLTYVALLLFLVAHLFALSTGQALGANEERPNQQTVYYVTTRLNEGGRGSAQYGSKRHLDVGYGSLDFGVARVGRPSGLIGFDCAPDFPSYRQGMIVNDQMWRSSQLAELSSISQSDLLMRAQQCRGMICIVIHGYGESMERSLKDTAVLADALQRKGVDVMPI